MAIIAAMKTIFISAFEGVEAKNILRTDVLKTILKDPAVRVILLTKDAERARQYRDEFKFDRMFCESIDIPDIAGIDRFFHHLKFTMLRTESTKLWRRLLYEKRGSFFLYAAGTTVNLLLARPLFIRASRMLDYFLVKSDFYAQLFDKYKPDLVFMANLFDEAETHLLREAKRRRIKTVGLINSWDRTTSRCILRLLPDKCIVFNNLIKRDLKRFDLVSGDDIYVSGLPHYDFYFQAPFFSREEFFERIGVNAGRKILLYAPFGLTYSNADWEIIKMLQRLNESGSFGDNISILVRCPPNDEVEDDKFEKLDNVIYEFPGKRYGLKKGNDWDMAVDELRHLSDSLYYMSVMVCYASSISIDGAVFDKPVININFDIGDHTPENPSPRRHYVKRHYVQALKTGGIRLVNNEEELVKWVNIYLNDSLVDSENRKRLVMEQCVYLDGQSGERIGNFILEYLNSVKS